MKAVLSKKWLVAIISIIMIAVITAGGVVLGMVVARNSYIDNVEDIIIDVRAKNVILMIGDGMGFNHLEAAKSYYNKDYFFMESAPLRGDVVTVSKTLGTTDSAAAATAFSCGVKVNNGEIARHKGKDINNMTEYAASTGRRSAIICTESTLGATPAAFSAHANNRNDADVIFESQLKSDVAFFACGEKNKYKDKIETIKNSGFALYDNLENKDFENNKVFYAFDSMETYYGTNESPTLAEVSSYALEYMKETSPDGFFMMIEGSHIDKESHDNDFNGMVQQLYAFDRAVRVAHDFAIEEGDTIVIVTADHETGKLLYEEGDRLGDDLYHSNNHTSANTPYFIFGNIGTVLPYTIDNTNISDIIRQLLAK